MKRFLLSVTLCISLLLIGLFLFMPSTGAQAFISSGGKRINNQTYSDIQKNVLPGLLNLPAPPPPNPFYRSSQTERDENFFNQKNPPADDAPIEDLLDYWKNQNQFNAKSSFTIKPSDKSLGRLMAEAEKKPEMLAEMLNVFPESKEAADFVKRLYDDEVSKRDLEASWREQVKRWLTYHSNYFSDELYQTASQAGDTKEYLTNQDEVLALARVDWEKAKPLLDKMLGDSNQPISQTLARWAYYKHALMVNDSFDTDSYRKQLQETVENKSLQPGNRDLAMDALVESGDYPGRDEWYYSLLEDETLYELRVNGSVYTGLTTMLNLSPDDKYVAKMIELAGSSNQTIRNAAVKNLSTLIDKSKSPEIIKALLPWLENPKWARENGGERSRIVAALHNYQIPESVPGLIAMLNEKEKQEVYVPASNSNVSSYPSNMRPYNSTVIRGANVLSTKQIESYPFRSAAIMALEKQKSSLAAAPLHQLLNVVEVWERPNVVRAVLASNGYTIAEEVDALEDFIKNNYQQMQTINSANVEGNTVVSEETEVLSSNTPVLAANTAYNPNSPNYLKYILATQLFNIEDPSDELVKAVIDRINFYDKSDPLIANGLRSVIQNWKGTAINSLLLRDLKDGKTNLSAIVKLLILRKDLREKQLNDVNDIRAGSPAALGISACLLEQPNDYNAILDGGSAEAQTAMLGCARLIRAALPVQKVAVNLKSQNKLLALAAERYLESEDSPEARQFVLSLYPNDAKILGATVYFIPENSQSASPYASWVPELFSSVDGNFRKFPPYYFYSYVNEAELEKKLQKEVKENPELFGIYSYKDNFVRIYKNKIVFSWQDDPARYRERILTAEEFEALKNFLVSQRIDELPPFLSACPSCEGKELLMLGKNGGRRVFVKAEPLPSFFAELENIFTEFRKQPAQIHYYLEKDVPGLEVLFADDNQSAETLWKDGEDFRLLIDDTTLRKQNEREAEEKEEKIVSDAETEDSSETQTETEENKVDSEKIDKQNQLMARQKEYGSYTWYKFDKTKLLDPTAQPPSIEFIPLVDGFAVQPNEQQWKARTAAVEIRADAEGLYKISRGQFSKIREGYYYKPLVTPNGRWAIATKYSESEENYGAGLIRFNLLTNKEFKIKMPEDSGSGEAVAFLPALNKILLFSGYGDGEDGDYNQGEREGSFFLLDVETGLVQPLNSEARPLLQQTFRPLQPVAAGPDLFWAAQPDREKNSTQFGIYNAKTLVFKSLLTIPQIIFNSMDMWIDERENKMYFVYEGQLLALPLPKNR